ncbi:MAG: AAA family ATPase [Gammaproteobacteria bacterium]|nr:AAA family ATPase [Gammaproteobacteria bacterium]
MFKCLVQICHPMDKLARRILVVNAKGGCGKTTIATNLAAIFSRKQSTMLLDYDPQGSSMRWLKQRVDDHPKVIGMRGGEGAYQPNVTRTWLMQNPDYERTVIDAPAGVAGHDLARLVHQADTILIPVQPSPIDIAASADFIRDLLLEGKVRSLNIRLGVVANRVKANTRVYQSLRRFLSTLHLPFVGVLRDTQNYMKAAEQGLGVHELTPSQVRQDVQQWQPILHWLDRKPYVEAVTNRERISAREVPAATASGGHTGATGSHYS